MVPFLLLTAFQNIPGATVIPNGSDAKMIGKLRPDNYGAMRDYRTLPLINDLSQVKWATFTGTVITLDFPQRGMIHVMNYRNGKRVVLDNPKQQVKENGVPLTKMLSTLPPKVEIRFAGLNIASFDVKLPGEEKKLAGFSGTLTAFSSKTDGKSIQIKMVSGKVQSSSWLKSPGPHK
ncbi:MAG: hypothetical protein WCI55_08405 [Armatimonadota bacterium]